MKKSILAFTQLVCRRRESRQESVGCCANAGELQWNQVITCCN
jgi:hypothetical protein